jgi:hypothetical protein
VITYLLHSFRWRLVDNILRLVDQDIPRGLCFHQGGVCLRDIPMVDLLSALLVSWFGKREGCESGTHQKSLMAYM